MNLFQPKTWLVGGSFTIQSQLCIRTPHSQNFNNACHPVQDVPTLVDSLWIWYHIQYVIMQRHCILLSCGILSYYSKLNTSPSHHIVVSIVLFSHYGVVVRNSFLRPSYLATHNLCAVFCETDGNHLCQLMSVKRRSNSNMSQDQTSKPMRELKNWCEIGAKLNSFQ